MHQIDNIITTYHPYVIYTQGLDFITFIVFFITVFFFLVYCLYLQNNKTYSSSFLMSGHKLL